jgi:2,4-dienoyl-CoA reductase-like NADH-dependent reductase (Old Yellow Enzyme family)/thioredoxin reductase
MKLFERLFSPYSIGKVQIKNRIVMPPMGTCLADINGCVTKKMIDYYSRRARGGVGLIILENTLVHEKYGTQIPNQLRIHSYHQVPQLFDLVEAVHALGSKIGIQINSPGSGMRPHLSPAITPISPSQVRVDFLPLESRTITVEEINEIILDFGKAARLAKLAGFDLIEIHGAHGYLINEFLSPYTNTREDLYGGTLQNRLRFCLEIIQKIREEIGDDLPLMFRMSVDDFLDGGMKIEEAIRIAKALEGAGIAAFDVSAGNLNIKASCVRAIPGAFIQDGHLAGHAKKIKEALRIPVIVAGKVRDPWLAEQILSEGKADFIAVGRGLLSDPDWAMKARKGKPEQIRKCISCNDLCIYRKTWLSHPIRCSVNPEVGREGEKLQMAKKPKVVVVVGGGPAGMEAARISALRGHRVVLYEKEAALGGQLLIAGVLPFKAQLRDLTGYMSGQITELGVNIHLNTDVTTNFLTLVDFDVLILATGAKSHLPNVQRMNGSTVYGYDEVLSGNNVKGNNVIVVGGGLIGCETAIYLAENLKKRVTIVEQLPDVGGDLDPVFNKPGLMKRLSEDQIEIMTSSTLEKIEPEGAAVTSKGIRKLIHADSVVLAVGRSPVRELAELLKIDNREVFCIGDCVDPRRLPDAIHEGFAIGSNI